MIWWSILAFCRIAIGLVFLISSGSKILHLAQFQQTITRFRLLPARVSSLLSPVVIVAEMAVVFLLAIGGRLLIIGFLLSILLLLIFCAALFSVLARSIQTSCHCFGTSEKPVTGSDIRRNLAFILCALAGTVLGIRGVRPELLEPMMWLLSGATAVIFVMVTISFDEILQLFRKTTSAI